MPGLRLYGSYVVYWLSLMNTCISQKCSALLSVLWHFVLGVWVGHGQMRQHCVKVRGQPQGSVPSSLGQALCCLPLQCMQEATGPASIWESPVSPPPNLSVVALLSQVCSTTPKLSALLEIQTQELILTPQALYFLRELPSHSFVMWFIWSNYLCKTLSKSQRFFFFSIIANIRKYYYGQVSGKLHGFSNN